MKLKELQAEARDNIYHPRTQINPKVEDQLYDKRLEGGQRIRKNSYHSVAKNHKSQLQGIVHSLLCPAVITTAHIIKSKSWQAHYR